MNQITTSPWASVLDYSPDYANLSDEFINMYANGCGSTGNTKFVPNEALGIDFEVCCTIHDLDCHCSDDLHSNHKRLRNNMKSIAKKYYSDKKEELKVKWYQIWKYNMPELIEARAKRDLLLAMSEVYYAAVMAFGTKPCGEDFALHIPCR